jgi:hypothetical protein
MRTTPLWLALRHICPASFSTVKRTRNSVFFGKLASGVVSSQGDTPPMRQEQDPGLFYDTNNFILPSVVADAIAPWIEEVLKLPDLGIPQSAFQFMFD